MNNYLKNFALCWLATAGMMSAMAFIAWLGYLSASAGLSLPFLLFLLVTGGSVIYACLMGDQ